MPSMLLHLLVLALLVWSMYSLQLLPQEVVVSVAIDAESLEIQREGLRLLQSIALFGGALRESRVSVCVSHSGRDGPGDQRLLRDLKSFNVTDVYFSTRFSLPHAAPTLNKLCAFEPRILGEGDHLLYLDADVFVAADPLPLLSAYAPLNHTTVLCGRPWNIMSGDLVQFPRFVGDIGARAARFNRDLLETLSVPGASFHGTCNTGVYFMTAAAARGLLRSARAYLHKAQTDPDFRDVVPFSVTYTGIDSIILWAAQYEQDFETIIFSPRLNWMAAAEPYYARYMSREVELYRLNAAGEARVDDSLLFEAHRPALLHFSRGSDLRFELSSPPHGLDHPVCKVILRAPKAANGGKSYVEDFVSEHVTPLDVCGPFAELLSFYDPLAANTTWPLPTIVDTSYRYQVKSIVPRFEHDARNCRTANLQRELMWCTQPCSFTLLSQPRVETFTAYGDPSTKLFLVLQVEIGCAETPNDPRRFGGSAVLFNMRSQDRPDAGEHVMAALDAEGRIHSEVHSSAGLIPPTGHVRWRDDGDGVFEFKLSFGASIDSGVVGSGDGGGSATTTDFYFDAVIRADPHPK